MIVVLVSPVLVNAVINSEALSCQTKAILGDVPRRPMYPISTAGVPVCVDANRITGSSMVVIVVSIAVLVPCTVKFPVTVRSEPYVKLLASSEEVIL